MLVEAKTGLFPQSAVTSGRQDIVASKTRAVAKAIAQGWATSAGLRSHGTAPGRISALAGIEGGEQLGAKETVEGADASISRGSDP